MVRGNQLSSEMENLEAMQEFEPRPYQIYLYEKAVEENSIIFLPTGTGKTFIAVLLIKRLCRTIQKPYKLGGKRTIFIVNTVALVAQQTAFISRHTGLICKGYTGDMQVEFWSDKLWHTEIESCNVMVMTAQIFLNMVTKGVMSLSKVNLIIFDECHRAVGDHPMRLIMQKFNDCPVNHHPRVLAMSACLLNANLKLVRIEEALKDLETTFHSKIVTVKSLQAVASFSADPKEFIHFYEPLKHCEILGCVQEIIGRTKEILNIVQISEKNDYRASSKELRPSTTNMKLNQIITDVQAHLEDMGLYGGCKSVLLHTIQLEYIKKSTDKSATDILEFIATQFMKIRSFLSLKMNNASIQKLINEYSSPKVLELVKVLKTFNNQQKDSHKFCCIIFVQRRFTAKVLYHILKELSECDEDYKFLKAEYVVGCQNDPYKNPREILVSSERNKQVLMKFRNGIINCIVATDVVDEGVDVPSCTLVVRYYVPQDFRAYIQSKGRARHHTSHFVILASSQDDYLTKHGNFQSTEKLLHTTLCGPSNRSMPTATEINNQIHGSNSIQPYEIIHKDGRKSVITERNAIAIVNNYCTSLFKSESGSLTPTWIKKEIQTAFGKQYKVQLILPTLSLLKEIVVGECYNSIQIAKRSAAVKAAIRLYEIGELDENLKPKKLEDSIQCGHLFPHLEEDLYAQQGTNRRRHSLFHPEALCGAYPQENIRLFLHVIEMEPKHVMHSSNDDRHSFFYKLLANKNTYGILSTKRLPKIPSFPIFMNSCDLQVNLKINQSTPSLTSEEMNSLRQFHWLIFNDILQLIKEFMVFDLENKENSFLIVPVDENEHINWDIVRRFKTIEHTLPSKPLLVTKSEYEFSLVVPHYRASNEYIVTRVCEDLRPESSFPTRKYTSYAHYFRDKHNLQITNSEQPLLEVKQITRNINFIKPCRKLKANTNKRKQINSKVDSVERLVPELCKKVEFPSLYWLKATALPSVLHRLKQLLVALELRSQIAREAGLTLKTRNSKENYVPLTVNDVSECCDLETNPNDAVLGDIIARDTSMVLNQGKINFTWSQDDLPLDLERDADRIQMADIEKNYKFMSSVTPEDQQNLKYQNAVKCNYTFATVEPAPLLKMLAKKNLYGPEPVDILACLTAKMSNDEFDYERIETLGDSFLKFAVSLYLFRMYPEFEEGRLTYLKSKLVSNSNLFHCGRQKNLPGRMNVEEFSPEYNFSVPGFGAVNLVKKLIVDTKMSTSVLNDIKIPIRERSSGNLSDNTMKNMKEKLLECVDDTTLKSGREHFLGQQMLSDKTVSDCVEAVIGTYLTHLGIEGALSIVKWFEILPKTLNVAELLHKQVPNPQLASGDVNEFIPLADIIEKRIGYKFNNRAFLLQALTHPSCASNRITNSYQRLEFLGDAVLDNLLTVHIFEQCGNLSPGELTDLRSALVNNITFACLTVRYGLHTALLAYLPKIFDEIDRFVQFQEERNHQVDDELLMILLEEEDCKVAEHVDVPKVLGDIYESLIGAIFLDCGMDEKITWNVIYNLMHHEIDSFSKNVPKQPTRVLYETPGANPKYLEPQHIEGSLNVMVTLSINDNGQTKFFHGLGAKKDLAKRAASKQALKYLCDKK